jgi:hypothetical protein
MEPKTEFQEILSTIKAAIHDEQRIDIDEASMYDTDLEKLEKAHEKEIAELKQCVVDMRERVILERERREHVEQEVIKLKEQKHKLINSMIPVGLNEANQKVIIEGLRKEGLID